MSLPREDETDLARENIMAIAAEVCREFGEWDTQYCRNALRSLAPPVNRVNLMEEDMDVDEDVSDAQTLSEASLQKEVNAAPIIIERYDLKGNVVSRRTPKPEIINIPLYMQEAAFEPTPQYLFCAPLAANTQSRIDTAAILDYIPEYPSDTEDSDDEKWWERRLKKHMDAHQSFKWQSDHKNPDRKFTISSPCSSELFWSASRSHRGRDLCSCPSSVRL